MRKMTAKAEKSAIVAYANGRVVQEGHSRALITTIVLAAVMLVSGVDQAKAQCPQVSLGELYHALVSRFADDKISLRMRGDSELAVAFADRLPLDDPPGTQVRLAREIGGIVGDYCAKFQTLGLVTVVFRKASPDGGSSSVVIPLRADQLAPGDTSSVPVFASQHGGN
jgi:hypothetical protein